MKCYAVLAQRWPLSWIGMYGGKETDDHGFALLSVIISSVLIAMLALTIMNYSRIFTYASAGFIADIETRSWVEAGLNRALLAYSRADDPLRQLLRADSRPVPWNFHGRQLLLRVQAESGKLDLNAGDRTHISNLMGRLIESPELRVRILAQIDHARTSGAKIESIDEILPPFVRMTSLSDIMQSYFTVFTNQIGIDANTAPRLTIETMPGLPGQILEGILRSRNAGELVSLANLPFDIARRFVPQRPVYTFRSETQSGFGKAGAMQAVVKYGERNKPSIFTWAPAGVPQVNVETNAPYQPF